MSINIVDWILPFLKLYKGSLKMAVCVWIIFGAILFSHEKWLHYVRASGIRQTYGSYIGVVFVVLTVYLAVESSIRIFRKWTAYTEKKRKKAQVLHFIETLDMQEKAVLREFELHGQSTLMLPPMDPVVAGLIGKGILEQVGALGQNIPRLGPVLSFKISDEVKAAITMESIGFPEEFNEKTEKLVMKNRPAFTRIIEGRKKFFDQLDRFAE